MAPEILHVDDDRFPSYSYTESVLASSSTYSVDRDPWHSLFYRSMRSVPLTLEAARGNWYTVSDGDGEGNTWKVFDGSGGAAVTNIGHGDFRVIDAEYEMLRRTGICYSPGMYRTRIAAEFSDFLLKSTDYQMGRVVLYGSGSEGNEGAQKLVIQYHAREKSNPEPRRTKFISRDRSYHGATLHALSLSGFKSRREIFEPVLSANTAFVSTCNAYRDLKDGMTNEQYVKALAQELEDTIVREGSDTVAGFVCEPVVGAAQGCVPAVPGYLQAMKDVCHKYGVLIILDEVMCGMGRTGWLHAWQEENVVPDLQIVGKGLAGGYASISAVLVSHEVADAFSNGPGTGVFSHGHTFQNFPKACCAGLTVQKIIRDENLLMNVREQGERLRQNLYKRLMNHPNIGDIRGKGLFWGIEFVEDKATKQPFASDLNVAWRLHELGLTREHGIFIYPGSGSVDGVEGDHIIIAPAFNITEKETNILVDRVVKLIQAFFADEVSTRPRARL